MDDPRMIARKLPRGTGIVLRHYGVSDRAVLARDLSQIARARNLVLFIAGDPKLATAVGAAGVHWPEGRLPARHDYGIRLWISAAAHSPRAILRARRMGAHAVFVSPLFPTRSGAEKKPIGPLKFGQWSRAAGLPAYALGGINGDNARRLMGTGAAGVAAIGAFVGDEK